MTATSNQFKPAFRLLLIFLILTVLLTVLVFGLSYFFAQRYSVMFSVFTFMVMFGIYSIRFFYNYFCKDLYLNEDCVRLETRSFFGNVRIQELEYSKIIGYGAIKNLGFDLVHFISRNPFENINILQPNNAKLFSEILNTKITPSNYQKPENYQDSLENPKTLAIYKPNKFVLALTLSILLTLLPSLNLILIPNSNLITTITVGFYYFLILALLVFIIMAIKWKNYNLIVNENSIIQQNDSDKKNNKEIKFCDVSFFKLSWNHGLEIYSTNPLVKIHFNYPENADQLITLLSSKYNKIVKTKPYGQPNNHPSQ